MLFSIFLIFLSVLFFVVFFQTIGQWKDVLLTPLVERLLRDGADFEYTDSDGHFPLLLAVQVKF